jgi:probable HAF family extracellular repeat protein
MMSHLNRQTVRAIGTLAAVGVFAIGLAASSAGQAVADSSVAASQTTGFQALGQMPGAAMGTDASGISGDGSTIAGYGWICDTFFPNGTCSGSSTVQAFRWTPAGGYQLLGSPGGSAFFGAGAVSYDGSVIVGEHPLPNQFAAFRWTAATGMTQLPMNIAAAVTPDGSMAAGGNAWWKTSGQTGNFGNCGDAQISLAMADLSADGSVAAGSGPHGTPFMGDFFHAYRSTPAGNCQDIDPVGNRNSDAAGISADGQVIVGEMQIGGPYFAFRWTASTGMVNLGDLGGGLSRADATNRDGSVVVGHSLTSGSTGSAHAFRWTAKTGMQDLQTLLKPPHGWILQTAIGVSADGTVITGNGFNTKLGVDEPWRAVLPLP